ncbi:hypothetical protein [Rhodococcus ruber]|uniref:hypothetical protein n=1 Tax=Rhodococcus ruber TaxID=1830 RepID=UPI003784D37B
MEKLPRRRPQGHPEPLDMLANGIPGLIIDYAIDQVNNFIADLVQGLKGATGGLVDLTGFIKGTRDDLDSLSAIAVTDVVTDLSGASGAGDVATFPRMLMVPDKDGNHPAYTPGKSVMDVYFVRADRTADFTRMKVIMGGDTAWFDIDDARLGLYRANPNTGELTLEWGSGNLDAVLGGTRKEYAVGMGKIVHVQQGEVLALAQLQIAPGLAQTPRQISCLNKSPVVSVAGAFPPITGGYRTGRSTLPTTINIADLTEDDRKIGWLALAP